MPKGGKKKGDEGVRETLLPIESDGVPSNSLADSHRQAIETVGEEVQHVNVDVSAFVKKVNELNTRKQRPETREWLIGERKRLTDATKRVHANLKALPPQVKSGRAYEKALQQCDLMIKEFQEAQKKLADSEWPSEAAAREQVDEIQSHNEDTQMRQQALKLEKEELDKTAAIVIERAASLQKLQGDMHSLVAMHRDLQAMVVEQGDQLDVVEDGVFDAKENAAAGQQEMIKAKSAKDRNRKCKLILCVLLLLVLVGASIPLIMTMSKGGSSPSPPTPVPVLPPPVPTPAPTGTPPPTNVSH